MPVNDIPTQALLTDTEVRQWEKRHNAQFSRLGILLLECRTKELWRYLPQGFHSFDAWLLDAMPCSRSTGYSALQVAERLSGIPEAERALISPGNLRTLAEVDDPKVIKSRPILDAAKSMKPAAFREHVIKQHPEQHIEAYKPMRFQPTESQREKIEEGIALCLQLGDAVTREEALEQVCQDYWRDNVYRLHQQKPKAETASVQ